MASKDELSPKQERFCLEFLVDMNGKQAAIRAGYSAKTAEVQASRLLSNAKVAERLNLMRSALEEKTGITVQRVLEEYAKIAFFDPSKIFKSTVGGDPYIDVSEATPDEWAAVTAIQCEDYTDGRGDDAREVRKVKVTLADKKGALDSIAKHLGMFTEKVEHSGGINIIWKDPEETSDSS